MNKKRVCKFPLVLIEWEDSVLGYQGWKFVKEQPKKVTVFKSVGFLVHEDKQCKILFANLEDCGQDEGLTGSNDIVIPCSAIRKVKKLR